MAEGLPLSGSLICPSHTLYRISPHQFSISDLLDCGHVCVYVHMCVYVYMLEVYAYVCVDLPVAQ